MTAPIDPPAALARAEEGAFDRKRFEKAPCYLCGYNGAGYYQPGTHPCAEKYHTLLAAVLLVRAGDEEKVATEIVRLWDLAAENKRMREALEQAATWLRSAERPSVWDIADYIRAALGEEGRG